MNQNASRLPKLSNLMRLIKQILNDGLRRDALPPPTSTATACKMYRGILCPIVGGLANQLICYRAGRMLSDLHQLPLFGDLSHFEAPGTRPLLLWNFSPKFDLVVTDSSIATQLRDQVIDPLAEISTRNTTHFWESETQEQIRKIYTQKPSKPILVDLWTGLAFQIAAREYFRSLSATNSIQFDDSSLTKTEIEFRTLIRSSKRSIAVHVRRTDFAEHDGGLLASDSQYNSALAYIEDQIGPSETFVFSDDITWCKTHLRVKGKIFFSPVVGEENGHKDLYLASLCRHKVLTSESTFSQMIDSISSYYGSDRLIARCSKRTQNPTFEEFLHA